MNRIIAMRGNFTSDDLYEIATSGDMNRLTGTTKSLKEQAEMFRIYGSGDYSHSVEGITAATESMIDAGYRPDMITVDYIQNLKPPLSVARATRAEQIENMCWSYPGCSRAWILPDCGFRSSTATRTATTGERLHQCGFEGQQRDRTGGRLHYLPSTPTPCRCQGDYVYGVEIHQDEGGACDRCELGFNIGNGKFLGVADRFSGAMDGN